MSSKGDWDASKIVLEGTCEPLRERVTLKGLPELKNLRSTPTVRVGGWHSQPDVRLTFSSGRPLEIACRVTALGVKTGVFGVKFFVAEPEIVSREDFEAYVAERRPARLDVIDVSGRRIDGRDLGALEPGRHSVRMAPGGPRAGMYFVRLTQDRRSSVRKAILLD